MQARAAVTRHKSASTGVQNQNMTAKHDPMSRFLSSLRTAGLVVGGGAAAALIFAVLGSILVALGVFLGVLVVIGGLQVLLFGRSSVAHVTVTRSPGGHEMIDITPPRTPRRVRSDESV